MPLSPRTLAAVVLLSLTALVSAQVAMDEETLTPKLLEPLRARAIGPATMSGRIAAVEAVPSEPGTIYVGAATGGLWKSTDSGLSWRPLTDDLDVASIGAVTVHPKYSSLVWVGTGEGNPRNSAAAGRGVYKSIDGGETFESVGLRMSRNIHRIIAHPDRPEVAWVGALGDAWADRPERGVFKTEDGGKTWRKVLYIDESTGCADLVVDPKNPNKLIAALWDFRREPWFFRSGGPGSGIFVSHNGGETWKRRTSADGLPEGDLGRIGLAVARSNPEIVYAYVEAKENAIYRSSDGGRKWRKVGTGNFIGNRPFYYADLRVDPENPNRVYSLWSQVSVSEDGGRTFRVLVGWSKAHPDHHAMWIHPEDPDYLINGNDGGIAISRDRGGSWRFVRNLPLAQYYHVNVDNDVPYHIYGGLQDNGSWRGPSQVWVSGGIRNYHWREVCFGDGFDTIPDPDDSMQGYAMSQEGYLVRWNLRTSERKDIRPVGPEGVELRFNWNAALAIDPFDQQTIYFGSQFVHRSRDKGQTWEKLSDDLTTNLPQWQRQDESGGLTPDVTGAENFTSLTAIAPSPVEPGVIWAGSDDGRLHVTRDAGESWTSVEGKVPNVPANTWIPHIEPSNFDAGTAYVVFEDHRRGNWRPYVLKTTDFGESWQDLTTDQIDGYALVVQQDPVEEKLLFLGTEFGLYFSIDEGRNWIRFKNGVPTVSVMDLAIQEREVDLVVATHGRALFVIDDYRPLRELASVYESDLAFFPVGDAQAHRRGQPASSRFPGQTEFRGENRAYGAFFQFWYQDAPKEKEKASIEIRDSEGALVRTLKPSLRQGLNRVTWNLRAKGVRAAGSRERDDREPQGREVLPGEYTATLKVGELEVSQTVRVLPDPRESVEGPALVLRESYFERADQLVAQHASLWGSVVKVRKELDLVKQVLDRDEDESRRKAQMTLIDQLKRGRERHDELAKRVWDRSSGKGIRRNAIDLNRRIRGLSWGLASHRDQPTEAQEIKLERAEEAFESTLAEWNRFLTQEVESLRAELERSGPELLSRPQPMKPADSDETKF